MPDKKLILAPILELLESWKSKSNIVDKEIGTLLYTDSKTSYLLGVSDRSKTCISDLETAISKLGG